MSSGERHEDDQAVREDLEEPIRPERPQLVGDAGAGLDHLQLPDVGQAEDDQAHAQGHDQRVDPEDADADRR